MLYGASSIIKVPAKKKDQRVLPAPTIFSFLILLLVSSLSYYQLVSFVYSDGSTCFTQALSCPIGSRAANRRIIVFTPRSAKLLIFLISSSGEV
jgi:hypothetical protein